MEKFDLYKDIQARTGGEIYVGVAEIHGNSCASGVGRPGQESGYR